MGTGWIGLACREEWMLDKMPSFFVAVGFGFLMMIPCSVLFKKTSPEHLLKIGAVVLVLLGGRALLGAFTTGILFNHYTTYFIFAFVAFQWGANFLIYRSRRA